MTTESHKGGRKRFPRSPRAIWIIAMQRKKEPEISLGTTLVIACRQEKLMKRTIVTFALGVWALSTGWAQSASGALVPGDILYLDWGDAINGAYVVKFVPGAGPPEIMLSHLNSPEAIAVDRSGQIIVASYSSIIRIDPASGS